MKVINMHAWARRGMVKTAEQFLEDLKAGKVEVSCIYWRTESSGNWNYTGGVSEGITAAARIQHLLQKEWDCA